MKQKANNERVVKSRFKPPDVHWAGVMRGNVHGLQAIRQEVSYTVYIHCYTHRFNIVLVNSVTEIPEHCTKYKHFLILLQTTIPDACLSFRGEKF